MPIDINQVEFSDCLRPETTKTIVHELLVKGRALNIVGPEGIGKRELLEDLKRILPDSIKPILIVFNGSMEVNFDEFLETVALQCGVENDSVKDMTAVEAALAQACPSNGKVLVMLYNLDRVYDNHRMDTRYNLSFFSALNKLKNTTGYIVFVACSDKPLNHEPIFVDDEMIGSPLDLPHPVPLPKLSTKQLTNALKRRGGTAYKLLKQKKFKYYLDLFFDRVRTHETPLPFFDHCCLSLAEEDERVLENEAVFCKFLDACAKELKSKKSIVKMARKGAINATDGTAHFTKMLGKVLSRYGIKVNFIKVIRKIKLGQFWSLFQRNNNN